MAVSKKALMRAERSAQSARARLARMRSKYENPNFKSIGAQALGGALPAYLDRVPMLPLTIAGIPTEGLIGGALIIASTQMKNNKEIFENLGSGMVAVTAYKLAKEYAGE